MVRVVLAVAALAAAVPAASLPAGAAAARCRPGEPGAGERSARGPCPATRTPAAKPEPYLPAPAGAGGRSGLYRLGDGTEIRIGGRVRMEHGARW